MKSLTSSLIQLASYLETSQNPNRNFVLASLWSFRLATERGLARKLSEAAVEALKSISDVFLEAKTDVPSDLGVRRFKGTYFSFGIRPSDFDSSGVPGDILVTGYHLIESEAPEESSSQYQSWLEQGGNQSHKDIAVPCEITFRWYHKSSSPLLPSGKQTGATAGPFNAEFEIDEGENILNFKFDKPSDVVKGLHDVINAAKALSSKIFSERSTGKGGPVLEEVEETEEEREIDPLKLEETLIKRKHKSIEDFLKHHEYFGTPARYTFDDIKEIRKNNPKMTNKDIADALKSNGLKAVQGVPPVLATTSQRAAQRYLLKI